MKLPRTIIFFILAALDVHAQSYSAVARWGQASAIIYDTLFIHGGKTDPSHQYTYTSAPNSNDLITLDMSSSFSLSAPPWSYVSGSQNNSTSQGPPVTFHTLTPYTSSQLLLFGGDAGFTTIGTNADSAWLLNASDTLAPTWISQSAGWASEPIRRIYHAAPSASGAVYILGGQKDDNSQLGFPDSYLFNAVGSGGSPAFTSLSDSSNDPAGLFGHAAHVLPGGMLIVFGGFFSSSNSPSPLTVVYTLDTTSPSSSWSMQNVSGTAPNPRRNFASALLENGKIFIHGGADAALQTLHSDGALLDTTQSPMSWSPVSGLSDALGARVDHFAAPIHNQVLLGFGWAGNAPASTNLVLYDAISGSFPSEYAPPASSVSVTTLPVLPTAPGGTYPSSGAGEGKGGTGAGSNPTHPPGSKSSSSVSGGNGGSDGNHDSPSPQAGVVLGSVLGLLAFVALAGGSVYYVLRRRGHTWRGMDANTRKDVEGRWQLMNVDQTWDADESPTHSVGQLQMAGTGWNGQNRHGWGILGLGALVGAVAGKRDTRARQRLDMLADEDVRQFGVDGAFNEEEEEEWDVRNVSTGRRREGTGGSSLSYGTIGGTKSVWSELLNASVTSFRNVSAALGMGATGAATAIQGRGKPLYWWEKDDLPLDPFSDNAAVNVEPAVVLGRRDGEYPSTSKVSNPYANPFADEGEEGHNSLLMEDEAVGTHDEGTTSTLGGGGPTASSQASLPRSVGSIGVTNAASPPPDPSTSVESHGAPSTRTADSNTGSAGTGPISSSSQASSSQYNSSGSSHPLTTSIIGIVPVPAVPMRRSDSWWQRFSRTSFRDRQASLDHPYTTRTGDALIDIRDPNPAPRLGPIRESTQSSQSNPQDTDQEEKRRRKGSSGYAPSTRSSVKTADSEMIDRMGGRMQVVQRALSLHSGSLSNLTDNHATLRDAGQLMLSTGHDASYRTSWTESIADTESSTVDSPINIDYTSEEVSGNSGDGVATQTPVIPTRSITDSGAPTSYRAPYPPRRALTGAVAARVSAYERRISQEAIPQNIPRSPTTDTKALQEERERHGGVGYGLVPKAPLFVANPDRRKSSGST